MCIGVMLIATMMPKTGNAIKGVLYVSELWYENVITPISMAGVRYNNKHIFIFYSKVNW